MRIYVVPRPYTLTCLATGTAYCLTSDEAQRVLDAYAPVLATSARVVLSGRTVLQPATRGGGTAFVIER